MRTTKNQLKTKLVAGTVGLALFTGMLSGCDVAPGSQADQTAIRNSHISPGLTPQQRIDKINNDPNITPEQKADFIAHIKAKNKIP